MTPNDWSVKTLLVRGRRLPQRKSQESLALDHVSLQRPRGVFGHHFLGLENGDSGKISAIHCGAIDRGIRLNRGICAGAFGWGILSGGILGWLDLGWLDAVDCRLRLIATGK